MDFIQIGLGLGLAVGGYVIYYAVKNGIPAAWTMLKGWWTQGKADLAGVKGDVASLEAKFTAELAAVKTDIATIKPKVGL